MGIKTAAMVYFGKDPSQLNLQESATLVGMCKNPSYYNPLRHSERTRERRNVVIDQMVKEGYLSAADGEAVKQTPLVLNYHKVDHNDGLAPYFREELRRVMTAKKPDPKNYPSWNHQAYVDDSTAWEVNPLYGWCNKNTKADGSHYDIYSDGLKIYTTIDERMQQYAEKAVKQHMSKTLQPAFLRERGGTKNPYTNNRAELSAAAKQALINNAIKRSERYRVLKKQGMSENEIMSNFRQPVQMKLFSYDGDYETTMTPYDSLLYTKSFLRCAMMSMDPVTGHVKAYVGGPDFRFFKYDMVSTGRRQIGSTVKPFVYSKAINDFGLTPCSMRPGGAPNIHWYNELWNPKGVGGTMTLKQALTHSTNSISAGFMRGTRPNWIEERGYPVYSPSELAKWMHSFGITSYLDPVPSLSLGISEITVREMVAAYSAFANGGMRVEPIYVTRITDNKGNVIKNVEKKVKRQVISKETSDKMNEILGYNTETAGATAGYIAGYKVAGKTGTSEKIGVKKKLSTFDEDYIASFCGYAPADDPQIAMLVFFDTPSGGAYYGSQVSSPVFINIMSEVLPYLEVKTSYNKDELAYLDTPAGDYTGMSVADAQAAVEKDGFTATVYGMGNKVVSQIPPVSANLVSGGSIVLYTDEETKNNTKVTVPDFTGNSVVEANGLASSYGLNVSFKGRKFFPEV